MRDILIDRIEITGDYEYILVDDFVKVKLD